MTTSSIIERLRGLLQSTPPFDLVPEEEREAILTDVSIEYFRPGEVILEQGTTLQKGLYVVESGLVRLMDVDSHRLIDKVGEGEFFGSFNLIKGGALIYEAKAVEPTVCAVVHNDRFQQLVQAYEDVSAFFQRDIKRYVRHIDKEMDVTGAHLLFSRRLGHYPHRKVVRCSPTDSAQAAAQSMRDENVDSVVVEEEGKLVGILTGGDLRNRLVAEGLSPDAPVSSIMSAPVRTLSADASVFEAMMVMLSARGDRLVLIENKTGQGQVTAVVTDRDIAHYRGHDPVATVQRIRKAPSVGDLATIRADTNEQLLRLYRQGVQPDVLNSIMSVIYDRLVIRLLELAERELNEQGEGAPDLEWAWLRLGSGGRQEMVLNSQQRNAIIYANPTTEVEARLAEKWFGQIAALVTEGLEACGFPVTEVVARQPGWRRPMRQWKLAYREWILQADSGTLNSAAFFFDLRSVYGKGSLVSEMKRDIVDALNVQAMDTSRHFFKMMASSALERKPPVSFIGRFQLERRGEHRRTFNIRDRGVLPVVDAARVLALELRYMDSTNTFDRLRHAAAESPELAGVLEETIEAYRYLVDFRLEDQLIAFENGERLDNQIDPISLRKVQQNLLRTVFSTVSRLQEGLAERYALKR